MNPEQLKRAIRRHMKKYGFPNVTALLAAAGVDYSTYWAWCNGRRNPNMGTLRRIWETTEIPR